MWWDNLVKKSPFHSHISKFKPFAFHGDTASHKQKRDYNITLYLLLHWLHFFVTSKSIHINPFKFSVYFTKTNLLFLFYTSTFTEQPHQFIYFTHLFNKIFIILQFFIIHSLIAPLSHRPTATITTIIST